MAQAKEYPEAPEGGHGQKGPRPLRSPPGSAFPPDESQDSPGRPLYPPGLFRVKSTAPDIRAQTAGPEVIPETSPGPANTPNTAPLRDPDGEGCRAAKVTAVGHDESGSQPRRGVSSRLLRPPPATSAIQGLGSFLGSPRWHRLSDGTSGRMSRWRTGESRAGRQKTGAHSPRQGPEHLQGTFVIYAPVFARS